MHYERQMYACGIHAERAIRCEDDTNPKRERPGTTPCPVCSKAEEPKPATESGE